MLVVPPGNCTACSYVNTKLHVIKRKSLKLLSEKERIDKQRFEKILHRILNTEQHEPHYTRSELRCSTRVGSSCTTSSTHHVTLAKSLVMGKV
jgi:hypothetical protein